MPSNWRSLSAVLPIRIKFRHSSIIHRNWKWSTLSSSDSLFSLRSGIQAVLAHFSLQPRMINISRSNENGDIESPNGPLKRRLCQHLPLRGIAEFSSLEAYDLFLSETLEKANAGSTERVAEELVPTLVPNYKKNEMKVGW